MKIEKRVEKWAIRLDIHDPYWYQRVNRRIELMSNTECVIGQAFGHYIDSHEARRFRRTWFPLWGLRILAFTPRPFFYVREDKRRQAEAAWRLEIALRRSRPAFDERASFLRKRVWHTQTVSADRVSERV